MLMVSVALHRFHQHIGLLSYQYYYVHSRENLLKALSVSFQGKGFQKEGA